MRIFMDMDGTMAEWKPILLKAEEDINEVLNKTLNTPGYYKNLKDYANMIALAKLFINKDYDFYIVSCVRPDTHSIVDNKILYSTPLQDKQCWLKRYLPELNVNHQIFIPDGINKAEYMKYQYGYTIVNDDILIDDYNKNLHEWTVAGGTAVKCLNNINSFNNNYYNLSICDTYTEESIEFRALLKYLDTISKEYMNSICESNRFPERE